VDPEIVKKLLDINYLFYQSFAEPFSATRGRLQPGVRRILDRLRGDERILDIGCGNGNLWLELAARGHRGAYVGVDFSPNLLEFARKRVKDGETGATHISKASFVLGDLFQNSWIKDIPPQEFDVAVAFAVLHHLPGENMRLQLLRNVYKLLAPDGRFCLSVWQFMSSPRFQKRVQSWSQAGIDPGLVDPGDYLLDWRAGGSGLRYVHQFNLFELSRLADESEFRWLETFFSDGAEQNLGCYQVWETRQE